jgi:hypothetical protein
VGIEYGGAIRGTSLQAGHAGAVGEADLAVGLRDLEGLELL